MPDTKVALLTQIQSIDASLDFLPIVDVSDTTMAVSGTTKKVTLNQLLQSGNYVVVPSGSSSQPALSFNADSNTGIYSPSGDQVAISAGGSGTLTVTNSGISVAGTITASGQISSTVATGTAPLTVTSTTTVTNLNADFLDGQHGSYYQNADNLNAGTVLAARMPAFSGDATSSAGSTSLTLANSGVTAGTYRSVTVDVKGRVTAGTNPTTLAGYGITDALDTSATAQTKVGNLTVNGSGSFGTLDVTSSTIPTSVGIYKPGTKRLGLSADSALMYELNAVTDKAIWYNGAGTSTRMTLDLANGRLGVGTVVPAGKLTVDSDTGALGLNVGTSVSPVRGNLWYDTDGTGWKFQIGKWQSSAFTPQMTFQDNGNVGIGTTSPTSTLHVVGTANITGNFSAPNGGVASSIRAAASDYAGVAFDGATSGTRVTSTLTGQNIGTGDFSMWARFKVPNSVSNSSTIVAISNSSASAFSTDGAFLVTIEQTNAIAVSGYVSSTFTTPISVSGFVPNYGGQIVDVVLTRATSGGTSTLTLYLNGIVIGTSTAAVAATSVTSTYFHSGIGAGGQPSHIIYRSVLFNRALSAADVTDLIETGVNPADQWGTQTQLANTTTNNGGFETAGAGGADVVANWQEYTAGTASIIRDTTDYSPDLGSTASAKMTGTDGTAVSSLYNTGISQFVAGKRYRIRAAHKRSSAATISWKTAAGNVALTSFSVTTAWANYSGEFVMPTNEFVKIDTSGTSSLWIDNVIYERIGAIVDLDLTKGIGSVAYDRSTNNLDATLVGGVSWTHPKTQPVVLEAGSTSAPSLTVAGDTNTGLYAPASDTLALATGGSDAIYIDSNRNVGIGIVPTQRFHVRSASGTVASFDSSLTTTGAANTGPEFLFVGHSGSAAVNLATVGGYKENSTVGNFASYLSIKTRENGGSLTERIRIDSLGRLGIGTTAPTSTLHVVGTANITGNFSAPNGDIASSIRAAASDYAGICGAGNIGSSAFVATTLTGQALGTGDWSVWARFKVPTSVNSGDTPVVFSIVDGASNYMGMMLTSINTWSVNKTVSGVAANADLTGFTASSYVGQVVDVVLVSQSGVMSAYLNGTQLTLSNTSSGFNWTSSAAFRVGGYFTGSQNFTQPIYRSVLFNRALSESDVVDLIENGVNPADQWGTQTAQYTKSTFASGVADSWNVTDVSNITATTGATAPDATTDWLRVERTGAAAGRCDVTRSSTIVVGGKRFRVSALIYNEDCGTQWFGVQADNYSALFASSGQLSNGSQGTISQEFITGSSTALRIGPTPSSVSATGSGVVSNGGNYYIKSITVIRVGAIVDLDFTTGIGSVVYDRSTNNLDGSLGSGVIWTDPKTQPVVLEAGSASAPSLTIAGDTNTGLYFPAADTVGFTTGGTERFRITSTGEIRAVGQGTASAPIFSRTGDTNTGLYFPAADTLALAVGGSDAVYIDSSRNVGIGVTPSGSYKLQVNGASYITGVIYMDGDSAIRAIGNGGATYIDLGTGGVDGSFVVRSSSAYTTRFTIKSTGQLNLTGLAADPTGAAGDLYYSTGNVLKLYTTSWNTLVHSGNVSTYALPSSGGTLDGVLTMGSGYQIRATDGTTSAPGISFSSDQNTGLMSAAADTMAVVTNGTERARVDGNGNVVVGTAALATNATDGFLYIPSCAGTPTGNPTAYSGRVPLVWDSTNDILYVRSGGSWKQAIPAV